MYEVPEATKSNRWAIAYYLLLLGLFVIAIWATASIAMPFLAPNETLGSATGGLQEAFGAFSEGVQHHVATTIGRLLLQIVVILSVARGVGWLFARMGQPTVIGEIIAGILLGPSLLGLVSPDLFAWLFPEESIVNIELLSQFGLILFMFTIGMELRLADIKAQARNSIVISQSGIFIPFILGMILCILTYSRYATEVPFFPLALFIGISMSITAFPVLARIVQERSMSRTYLGKLALNTAAAGDIMAWLMLAAIMAITQSGSFVSALFNFLFLMLYMGLAFGVLRPLFSLIGRMYNKEELLGKGLVGGIFILLLLSAYLTEILSMHALFGAFIFGLIMPEDVKFRHVMTEKVEDVSLNIFLPLFFVSSGLRTELGLINSGELWLLLLLFVLVAVVGKVGGTYLAARICGINSKDSLYLGAYMNTRGLMELVVLKIGLDLGVLPSVFFAILVLMTLITTVMTTPLIHLIDYLYLHFHRPTKEAVARISQRILIAFGRPETGALLLRLARQLFPDSQLSPGVSLLHVTMSNNVNVIDEETFFAENFQPALREARHLGLSTSPIYRVSDQVTSEIIDQANLPQHTFLLVGAGLSLSGEENDRNVVSYRLHLQKRWRRFSITSPEVLLNARTLFNDKMTRFAEETNCALGVFVDRHFGSPKKILAICRNSYDAEHLIPYALRLAHAHNTPIALMPLALGDNAPAQPLGTIPEEILPLTPGDGVGVLRGYDFLFITYDTWSLLTEVRPEVLQELPSTLILRPLTPQKDSLSIPANQNVFE